MTQGEMVIDYINRFGAITPMEAFSDLGITKLSTRVGELEKKGYTFDKHYIEIKNRFGKRVRFMCYRLRGVQ